MRGAFAVTDISEPEAPTSTEAAPAAPSETEPSMDIHKPKPWTGLRELAGELLVIFIGVLMALAAEQGVEALHWRHQVAAGQEELKQPFAREVRNAAVRAAQGPCVTQRLDELSSILQRAEDSGRLPPLEALTHPSNSAWTVGTWDALVAAGTLAHMPHQKMLAYTRVHQQSAYLSDLDDQEKADWTILDSMSGPGRRLSDVEAEQLRLALTRALAANRQLAGGGARLAEFVKASGLVEPAVFATAETQALHPPPGAAICRPLSAETAGAR
jgi:hypothetical protein